MHLPSTPTPAVTSLTQLEHQVSAAHAAFERALAFTPQQRGQWLRALAAALERHASELVALAQQDTHLPAARLNGELKRSMFQLHLLADEISAGAHLCATIDLADPEWGMGPRPDLRRVNQPLGVVGVFGASNFPFAFSVIGGDSASALAAGCALIHKLHDAHLHLALRTAEIVVQALHDAGAPEGLFSAITGLAAGQALVEHPKVKAIGFTGSVAAGRALFDRASRRAQPIPFFGELGSVNPVVVTPAAWAARRDDILGGYAASFTLGMGQFCTKPGVLFVPAFAHDPAAIDAVTARLHTTLADVPLSPLLSPALRAGFDAALAQVKAQPDVKVLLAGTADAAPRPTLLLTSAQAVQADPALLRQEIFGPASVIVQYQDEAELVSMLRQLEGQLTCTLHAQEDETPTALLALLQARCGRVLWNGWPTGVTVSYAQHHGGPYPASTAAASTSVGTAAIARFMRPVAYQSFPDALLPAALQNGNPWRIARRVNGRWETDPHTA